MSLHPFLASLGFDKPADIDAVERRVLEVVKEHLQKVSTSFDEAEVKREEAWLRDIHVRYFQYTLEWVMEEARQNKGSPNAEAVKLKKQARDVMTDLQKHMIEFSCCYMHINRFMTLLRDEMRIEEQRLGISVSKETKWTSDAGAMMARYRTQKRLMVESADRMKKSKPLLDALEGPFETLRQSIGRMYGGDKVETLQRSVIAALRTKDFARARRALDEIANGKKKIDEAEQLLTAGRTIIDTCEQYQDLFVSDEDRLFLKSSETDQAYNVYMRELRKIKAFLAKYYMPYMQYKLEVLLHLKDKLLVIGSIESQMTLYRRLLTGFARPLADIKEMRAYESEVLDKIKYLLGTQFQEVPVILARARETVSEFRTGADEFRDIEKMDTSEISANEDGETAVGL